LEISVFTDTSELGAAAAADGAVLIKAAIAARGKANVILATGVSQFDMIDALVAMGGIDWSKVTAFHLDEYIGLPISHPASFRRYLKERFQDRVDGLGAFHFIDGEADDPEAEAGRLGEIIAAHPIDAAFIGIGENGHLAFNDPPADFTTEKPYLIVTLDDACRRQQMGEGWFERLEEVPARAISMSIRHILKSTNLIVCVPDGRKADAVKGAVESEVSPHCPASILQTHPRCRLYLDPASRAGLTAGRS
jgi:glucosamine-6-phosphate deaminase